MNPHPDQVEAGKIVGGCLKLGRELCKQEIEAEQLDREIETFIRDHGGEPGLKGYHPKFGDAPYEHAICLSLDNEVVHGVPKSKLVTPDHLITIDLVVRVGDWHADAARTFTYSDDEIKRDFLEKCHTIFMAATATLKPGLPVAVLGVGVEAMARGYGFHVVDDFCGHGIGTEIHEEPQVYNHSDLTQRFIFEPGKSYAIEPVIAREQFSLSKSPDGWTYTADCLVTHFEDTFFVGNECIMRLTEEDNG